MREARAELAPEAMPVAEEPDAVAAAGEACADSGPVQAVPPAAWPKEPRSRLPTAAAVLLSFVLHGGAVAAGLAWVRSTPGAIEPPTRAVSVEMTETLVLEAVHDNPVPDAARSEASAAPRQGETVPETLEAVQEPEEEVVGAAPPVMAPVPESLEVITGESPDKAPAEAGKVEKETRPERAERERPKKRAAAKPSGGAISKAVAGNAASSGRVSASTGSILSYAARVRARVAANKPAGGGRRGTVVVSFGVTRSGGLSYASVSRSSGDPGLDRSVLAAVRGAAPFPPPPSGAAPGQLRFAVPFRFQ